MRPRKTILCVDDNEQALSVRKFMLETRGYRVLTAHTSADALEIFAAGNVDLVLSDLIMPQMDGNELVRRMKSIALEVLERIRVMIARKRGPRKAQPREHEDAILSPMTREAVTAAG